MKVDTAWRGITAPVMAACVVALGVSALLSPMNIYGLAFIAGGLAFLVARFVLNKCAKDDNDSGDGNEPTG